MKKLILSVLLLTAIVSYAQTYDVGIRIQKTHNMYLENGISLKYSFKDFAPNQFYLGFDYVTSRLGSAINSNAIKQDNYIFSSSWYFFKEKPFHLITRLNVGYFYSDYEEPFFDELPNTAFLLAPEIGVNYTFKDLPIALNLGSGYYIDLAKSGYSPGTLQPLYYHLDIHYTLFKNTTHE
jgi:hypothetical protein